MSESDPKDQQEIYGNRLSEIFRQARLDTQRENKEGKKAHKASNETIAKYFTLLSEYYSRLDPDKSNRMKLFSDFATVMINPLADRERWKDLLHQINIDRNVAYENDTMRQNLSMAALYNSSQIEGCPISL
jgi:hypothetical protein